MVSGPYQGWHKCCEQIGLVNPPPPSKYTLIDTNSVHNVTVCVDFVKNDTFLGTSFVDNLPKSCFLFAFSPTKLLATSTRFIASVLKKVPLKLQGLLKLKHFDSQVPNFGPVLPNSRKRLRNFYHSIVEIKIVLFLRLVLKQHDELKACSKYTAVA